MDVMPTFRQLNFHEVINRLNLLNNLETPIKTTIIN
jgi:hypothetical protein